MKRCESENCLCTRKTVTFSNAGTLPIVPSPSPVVCSRRINFTCTRGQSVWLLSSPAWERAGYRILSSLTDDEGSFMLSHKQLSNSLSFIICCHVTFTETIIKLTESCLCECYMLDNET